MVELSNPEMRHALLVTNGLEPVEGASATSSKDGAGWALDMVRRLGFVQVDSISVVERAQHHILLTRNPRYRREDLKRLLIEERALFENWTHDAAILPSDVFPYWKHYFARARNFPAHPGYRRYFAPVTSKHKSRVLRRIAEGGPLRPRDVATARGKVDWHDRYFARPTLAKITLELLWRTGKVAVARREGQEKVYDLAERVIPAEHYAGTVSKAEYVEFACREALARLVIGTPAQIARFFDAVSTDEAARWCASRRRRGRVIEASYARADGGSGSGFALAERIEPLRDGVRPVRALRVLSPFDPLIHDRLRTRRVFGFDYTVEIWVPAGKRKYGYYVLPVLEGANLVGRLDAKVDRAGDRLQVLGWWWEPGVALTASRRKALVRELDCLARFAGVSDVTLPRGA